MKSRSSRLALLVTLALAGAGGCHGHKTTPIAQPTQPGSGCVSAGSPSPDPSLAGLASVRIEKQPGTPDSLQPAVYRFEDPFLVVFSGPEGELVICGGPSFTGSRPTSDEVAMSIAIDDGRNNVAGLSFHGECTVDMTEMTPDDARGSFKCAEVEDTEGQLATFSASGTFSASRPGSGG